ncbi:unnamed protein product [Urochloa decumbens]|uniref:Uncharacterized protein n=1 Tax=Urochloa decumbens TaxID=240449 RepID=A0ABC9EFI3_9POAL
MCMSIGMDLSPEPTMLIHINSSRDTDFNTCLGTVFEFFHYLKIEGSLVLVILPEARYSHGDVELLRGYLGLVYQFCLPWHARSVSEKYLKNVANKIKTKVLQQCNTLSDCDEDMSEDSDPGLFYGLAEKTEESSSEQSDDSDAETGAQLYSSHKESGEQDISEKLAGFDKETAEDDIQQRVRSNQWLSGEGAK